MRFAILAALLPTLSQAAQYAVIAVGSKGYLNYRHQADACHAYQILKKSGIPEENIILMMEDDVADFPMNPFRGKLFNKPGENAVDVYAGCKVEYSGKIVTAKLFLSVITGDESGVPENGKVLKSGPNDDVFINFVDHGGVGIIAFPSGPTLHAKELSEALFYMSTNKMYKQLVFYMEACESGSMFPDLLSDSKALAVTAANARESSWGTYCSGAADKVNGKSLKTCLGDLFSVSWMEDSDLGNLGSETLQKQIQRVTKRTNKSHVMTFGDKSFESEPIGNFQNVEVHGEPITRVASRDGSSVDVRDIDLYLAYEEWSEAKTPEEKAEAQEVLTEIIHTREEDEAVFKNIVSSVCRDNNMYKCKENLVNVTKPLKDMDCHMQLTKTVFHECPRRKRHFSPGGWNGFNMKFSQVLANLCEGKTFLGKSDEHLDDIVKAECTTARLRTEAVGLVV